MKPLLSILLVVPLVVAGAACGSKSQSTNTSTNPTAPGDTPGGAGGGGDTPSGDLAKNPIDGVAAPAVVVDTGAYTDGPIWDAKQQVIFFTTPLGEGGLYRMREDGSVMKVRDANVKIGDLPIGNTLDKSGTLVTFEAKRVMRGGQTPTSGAPTLVLSGYPDADAGGAVAQFDTLNDGVVASNGTMYMTDPGYMVAPIANRIFRVTADGKVSVVEAFEDVPRPNGIALSPDQKTLYVGFTAPGQGTTPYVRKYIVNPDGSIGEHAKFADVSPADSEPDGIEVDKGGNVYVATKQGVAVFKSDGTKIGIIALPDQPTAMAFGGTDMQMLYITTQGTKIYSVHVNVPGIAQ